MENELPARDFWKKCSVCKKGIPFRGKYFLCSVSTCRGKRTGLTFCSVVCWDSHLGMANHRSSYAEELVAPGEETRIENQSRADEETTRPPRRKVVTEAPQKGPSPTRREEKRQVDTLVVVSRVKAFVQSEAGFNTSQCAIDALTQKVVQECLKGIDHAKDVGRKTLMGRDIS